MFDRVLYRQLKSAYKMFLVNRNDENLSNDVAHLETQLDIVNIIMAREHAKLEVTNLVKWICLIQHSVIKIKPPLR